MGTTPLFQLPYPEPSSSVDVPRDIKALALAVDAKLTNLPALTANILDYEAAVATEVDVPFTNITLSQNMGGAFIDGQGFISVPLAGLYFVSLNTMGYALGWGGQIGIVPVGLTQADVLCYVSHVDSHIRITDSTLIRMTANYPVRCHLTTGGQFSFIRSRMNLIRIGP